MCGDHLGRSGIERGRPLAGSSSYPSEDDSRGQCVRALQFSECRYVGCRDLRMYRHGFRPRLDGACRALRPGRGDSRHRGHVSAPGHGRGASRPPPRRQPGVRANAEDARHTRFHWPCTWVSPRTLKQRKPSTSLIHPFGASDGHLRGCIAHGLHRWPASAPCVLLPGASLHSRVRARFLLKSSHARSPSVSRFSGTSRITLPSRPAAASSPTTS